MSVWSGVDIADTWRRWGKPLRGQVWKPRHVCVCDPPLYLTQRPLVALSSPGVDRAIVHFTHTDRCSILNLKYWTLIVQSCLRQVADNLSIFSESISSFDGSGRSSPCCHVNDLILVPTRTVCVTVRDCVLCCLVPCLSSKPDTLSVVSS